MNISSTGNTSQKHTVWEANTGRYDKSIEVMKYKRQKNWPHILKHAVWEVDIDGQNINVSSTGNILKTQVGRVWTVGSPGNASWKHNVRDRHRQDGYMHQGDMICQSSWQYILKIHSVRGRHTQVWYECQCAGNILKHEVWEVDIGR